LEFFVFHIYYSLYIRREASRDLDTEKDFKKDFILFLGKNVVGRPLKPPWMLVVSSFMTFLVLPWFGVSFDFPYKPRKPRIFTQRFFVR
jgi:hypothetical protein